MKTDSFKPHTVVVITALLSVVLTLSARGENWIPNGDFEGEQPFPWSVAKRESEVVHAGNGALRLEASGDKPQVSARLAKPIAVDQAEAKDIMAGFWMRFDAVRQTGAIRGGMTFAVDFADGTTTSWYAPFELSVSEMGNWVYREQRWKPPAPVKRIRPLVYLQGCEGVLRVDDLYLGPPVDVPAPHRSTIPLTIAGEKNLFTDWPQIKFTGLRPNAHVFHLSGPRVSNLELTCDLDVMKTAPTYLSSSGGSQYWMLYSPARRELVQIYTNERFDLSKPGPQRAPVRMSGFSDGASELAPGGYVFLTDCMKRFYMFDTVKPADAQKPRWDAVKFELLSRGLGEQGCIAPFSLADLHSYRVNVRASRDGARVRVTPTLVDARESTVPLHGLDLQIEQPGHEMTALVPEILSDGIPSGDYLGDFAADAKGPLKLAGKVLLATPDGAKELTIDRELTLDAAAKEKPKAAAAPLDLLGWGYASGEFSAKASHAEESMRTFVADAKAAGISKLLVAARNKNETFFHSRIALPETLTESDALALAVAEGRRQGVGIYASYILGVAQTADLKAHPGWTMFGRDGKPQEWYCFNHPDVRAFHSAMLAEIATRYDVAGVVVDYVRPGSGCYCERCAKGFEAKYQKPLKGISETDADWIAWRHESIDDYVTLLRASLRKARPGVQFGAYVWSRFAPDKDRAIQNWPRWLKEGLMDFVAIGQYTPSVPWFRAECHATRVMADRELGGDTKGIHVLLGGGYLHLSNPSHADMAVAISRGLQAARDEGLQAAGFFSFHDFRTHLKTAREFSNAKP